MHIEGVISSIIPMEGGTLYGLVNGRKHLVFQERIAIPKSFVGAYVRAYCAAVQPDETVRATCSEVSYNPLLQEAFIYRSPERITVALDESWYSSSDLLLDAAAALHTARGS